MDLCAAQPDPGFISSVTGFIDCQSQALGSDAWHALSLPGSTLSVVLSGFLTIFIALTGYSLLLGQTFTVRSATLAMLKIGAVFALATSWPAYRTLVYDLTVDGPAQLAGDIGRPSGVPGSDGTLVQRLDATDAQLAQLAVSGVGIGIRDDVPPPPFAGFNAFALGGSRILYLMTAIAGIGVVRLVAGLMLALGPFFIAFLMFDSTRSLFEGWVRVIAGAALAAVGVSIALGFELAMLRPWLADVLARRMVGEDLPTVPVELFVLTSVYTILVIGLLVASVCLARAFRLGTLWPHFDVVAAPAQGEKRSAPRLESDSQERSRAAAIADVLVARQRRESGGRTLAAIGGAPEGSITSRNSGVAGLAGTAVPVGRSFRRQTRARMTASGGKRDTL